MNEIQYKKTITKVDTYDVAVIGGGPSGLAAAIAAARNGANTLLVEKNGVLGGMATAGLVGPFMCCYDNDGTEQLAMGIFEEVCRKAEAMGGLIHPSKVPPMSSWSGYHWKSHHNVTPYLSETLAVVYDELVTQSGAKILFDTRLVDAVTDEAGQIDYLLLANKGFLSAVRAKVYIDCTGDADVAFLAGAPTWKGEKDTGVMQPMTLIFEVGNIDRDALFGALEERKDELGVNFHNAFWWLVDKARAAGEWHVDRNEVCIFETSTPGRIKVNTTRIPNMDGTDPEDITTAYIDGRKQVQEIMTMIRKYLPGCENAQLLQVASQIGVRETRHIVGKYELSTEDIMHRTHFDDAIATYGYAIDLHLNDSSGVFTTVDKYYSIPYRSMLPVKCGNLLVAGRSICASSSAAAAFRVMPCAMTIGQAAGTAAAQCVRSGCLPGEVNVKLLQQSLLEQGAVIKDAAL